MDGCYIERVPHELPADAQLWRVDLDAYPDVGALDGLTADELARAARMAFGRDGRRFLASRHALRRVLANTVNCAADTLVIDADAFGKPRLLNGGALEFNLSHSAHECLIGISAGRPIGVDIEVIQTVIDADALARAHFTAAEHAEWWQAPVPSRDRAFLACWTRKEACLKALGVGLSAQPAIIEAGCTSDARVAVIPLGSRRCEVALCSLRLPGSAVAAVALAAADDAVLARGVFGRQ